ncbi:serine beta-lactamase-like protein LACTB, mitochondrial [Patiria miniata]|uniref:Beta-lactamase-related domain-containing protein n=1 Tax=Patiria miniata TaxID=46514 RepID=A0A914BMV8_PATMI|nr:serine beta-lactamase-like protein LACTB, mitochondrial [Patiria miniata]
MLRIKSSLVCLGRLKSGNLKPARQKFLKSYSSGARTSGGGGQRWRTQIVCALGGGLAVGVGLVASLWYSRSRKVALVGLEEAACHEKHRWRGKDASPWRQEVGAEAGLQEAVRRSRDLLRRVKDEAGSPGIVVAVSVDGKLLWAEGMGYADVENRLPCTSKSVHRIASISKSLTMTAVAKLWEEGKLDLDKPIQHYVPEFPEKEVDGKKVEITTRQLVSHLAGIRHYSKDYIEKLGNQTDKDGASKLAQDSKTSSKNDKTNDATKTMNNNGGKDTKETEFYVTKDYSSVVDALELFKDDPLRHKPGSKYYYTTHGWTLVSAVVDAAADEDFLVYMKKIFKDLGLTHTVPDEASPLIYNRARGYTKNKKGRLINVPAVNLSHKWAGGGFLSDVGDLVQFGNAMLYSYQYTNKHRDAGLLPGYLKPETMKAIWSPVPLAKCSSGTNGEYMYAMGWQVHERGEHRGFCPEKHQMVWHLGGAVGASSALLVVNRGKPDTVSKSEPVAGDTTQDVSGLGDAPSPNDLSEKWGVSSSHDSVSLPEGIVVAMIVNVDDVSLFKAAVEIAQEFQKVHC